jgi:hypothetical protein
LRLLVEQSELWIYKIKENHKEDGPAPLELHEKTEKILSQKAPDQNYFNNDYKKSALENELEIVGNPFVLQELENGPVIDYSAIIKYKELYKILFSMTKLCVHETKQPDGSIKKKARQNDQRLLRFLKFYL